MTDAPAKAATRRAHYETAIENARDDVNRVSNAFLDREQEARDYYATAPEFHPKFSPVKWVAVYPATLYFGSGLYTRSNVSPGIADAAKGGLGDLTYNAGFQKPGSALILRRVIAGKDGPVIGFINFEPGGEPAGSLEELAARLVQELAPDQGNTPSPAFALAIALQASLASGSRK